MNNRLMSGVWGALLGIAGAVCPAQAQDIRLNVLRSDQYALRKMVVIKKSGEKISTFVKIDSYDPATGIFVMEDFTGQATSVRASDIQKIEFGQAVLKQSPVAQEAHWEINKALGPELSYKVPQGSLKIESGDLVLPASSFSTSISPTAVVSPEPSSGNGGIVTSFKMTEARNLTIDTSSNSFLVEVQSVIYTKETSGSSGSSGTRK